MSAASLVALGSAAPAAAQIGASVSIVSDDRFRGYSLSDGRPVGIVDFALDDPSGLYGEASVTGVADRSGPALLGEEVSGGFARQLSSGATLDLGFTHSSYSHYSGAQKSRSYTEFFAGISKGALSSRFFISPDYFSSGRWTAYGELNGNIHPFRKWSIDGHVGVLVPLRNSSPHESYSAGLDWRIGVTRELGPMSLNAALSEGFGARDYYSARHRAGPALVVGASWAI